MLRPDKNRVDYGEALYPPEGYVLSSAIGCTYSLSLDTLINIPISLVLSSEMNFDGNKGKLQILDGLIKTMDKIKVYCQKGKILVPSNEIALYSLLENSISQVISKANSSFHPKLWVVRYEDREKKLKPKYKVIVLSRNLTGDRSYDISMVIDGVVTNKNAEANRSLCDFLSYLNKKEEFNNSNMFLRDLRKVDFSLEGSGIESLEFLPIVEGKFEDELFTNKCDDLLVISPFLSEGRLKQIYKTSKVQPKLISRKNELDKIKPEITGLFKTYHLKDEIVDGERILDIEDKSEVKSQDIHSKIYIRNVGEKTEVYLGSANCSHRAFTSNIEFLVKLVMNKKDYSVKKALQELMELDKDSSLFTEYIYQDLKVDPKDLEINTMLDFAESEVASLELSGYVNKDEDNKYSIILEMDINKELDNMPGEIVIELRPLTIRNNRVELKNIMVFKDVELKDITSFFIVNINYMGKERGLILKLELRNLPEERNTEIVKGILNNKKTLLNYISFILEDPSPVEIARLIDERSREGKGESGIGLIKRAMFEKLLKAASRDRERIKEVRYIMELLGNDEIVPEDFREMFKEFENYV